MLKESSKYAADKFPPYNFAQSNLLHRKINYRITVHESHTLSEHDDY